jgi:3-oxoacyl-[acyl-carrier-protein] synthase-3
MIGIKAIASYVPDQSIDNLEQGRAFGESAEFMRGKIGAVRLARKAADEETSDLAAEAVRALVGRSALKLEDIDALIVVTQNPDESGLPHTAAIVQYKLGLGAEVAAFDVSLGCSGFVYGLSVMKGLLQETGLVNGVLVTADPYSKVIDPADRVTSLLFGDAATATWIGPDADWHIGRPLLETDGSGAANLEVRNGRLTMNGRQVFNFAAVRVPDQITRLLEREGLVPEDIDYYCIHQGSAAIVNAVARRFPKVKDRFVLDMLEIGNTVSSTIPLLLEKTLVQRDVRRVLISGFGVGLSWASTILTRRDDQ